MSDTAWAHLPNARHIDAVLADVGVRRTRWKSAWTSLRRVAATVAEEVAEEKDLLDVGAEARLTIDPTMSDADWLVKASTIDALIAWDSAADLLDCTPDVLRAMVDLAEPPVCHQAALLLPYAIVRMTK